MKICTYCGKEFENGRVYSNHVRWQHLKIKFSEEGLKKVKDGAKKSHTERDQKNQELKGKLISEERNCSKCDSKFLHSRYENDPIKERVFCNRSCANSRDFSKFRESHAEGMQKAWKENDEFRRKQCETRSSNKIFSSGVERSIVKHFREKFAADEWTSGGGLKIADKMYTSRDLYSNKLKICVEYDGVWHFKDIHGQLESKTLKDKLLEEWCIANDYRLVRISEDFWFTHENALELLENAVYNSDKVIEKLFL